MQATFTEIGIEAYCDLVEASEPIQVLDLGGVSFGSWKHPILGILTLANTAAGQAIQLVSGSAA
jgi:hypothetical protein